MKELNIIKYIINFGELSIIKYIMSLGERDRFIAVCLIAVGAMWSQGLWDKHSYNRLQDSYRIELVKRSDSCDIQKMRILIDNINIIHKTEMLVDSLAKVNLFIISNNNKNIKIVKKAP